MCSARIGPDLACPLSLVFSFVPIPLVEVQVAAQPGILPELMKSPAAILTVQAGVPLDLMTFPAAAPKVDDNVDVNSCVIPASRGNPTNPQADV